MRVGDTHLELYVGVLGANNLVPDAFSASNPYVVELDGREIFRTDEIKISDPKWHEFLLLVSNHYRASWKQLHEEEKLQSAL